MPYITDASKPPIDQKVDAVVQYFFGTDPATALVKPENAIFFWYRFLETLYVKLCKEVAIADPVNGMRYRHYCALHGTLNCALEELFSRWNEAYTKFGSIPLEIRAPRIGIYEQGASTCLDPSKSAHFEKLVGELIASFSPDFLSAKVGDVNYAISEVGNAFGNTGNAGHQEMLDAFVSINHAFYRNYVFPYEKTAVSKNGDTRGFLEFWRILQERYKKS